jgi:predicted negative regulator of RcsB-dependent stress response
MISEPLYSDEFVGRRDELDFLSDEFRAACDARVRLIVVDGDAGIGKSRLVREFFNAIEPSATIATGHCSENVRVPYLPFTEILERLDPHSRLAALKPREQRWPSDEKWAYFNAVADVVRAQSARRPVALAIEDAQWTDSASSELLRFLLQRLHAARVLAIVTMRSEVLSQNPAAAALRAAASRHRAATIQLRSLRRNEINHLVHACVQKRNGHLDSAMAAQIEALAEGNPLFAEELAQIAVESGALSFQSRMPVTLQAILSERLAPFSSEERALLVRAAILGQAFDAHLLTAVTDSPLAGVLDVLSRAVASGLLQEVAHAPARLAFRHALIRQALADQLIFALAAPLHVRIAEELEALPDSREREAELAYHWSAAHVGDKARYWNECAGRSAVKLYAYRDAIRFYTEALRWEYPAGTARAALYERIGMLLYIDGCGDEPAQWFARAREEYTRCSNAAGAAHALLLEADQSWVDARTRDSVRAALEAGATLHRLGHMPMYAQALLSVARFSITLGHIDRALAHLAAAQPLHAHFDAASRAAWHEVRGETHAACGDTRAALADFRAAARLAAESGVSELIAQIENNFALAAFDLGDLDLAIARHQIAVDEAERTALTWRAAYSSLNYARTLMYKGEPQRARALVWDALKGGVTNATFKTKAASVGIPLALQLNDRALLAACDDPAALDLAEQSGEVQRIASVTAAFAALRVAEGSAPEAQRLLRRAIHSLTHAHRAWDLFVAIAMWSEADEIALARSLLQSAVGRPRVKPAYCL